MVQIRWISVKETKRVTGPMSGCYRGLCEYPCCGYHFKGRSLYCVRSFFLMVNPFHAVEYYLFVTTRYTFCQEGAIGNEENRRQTDRISGTRRYG
ncbi:hypothetical protein, partial [Phocaeicola sp.]|uniref:hypothetical protein n=1 Tax=Phocaeicola sp. TaxID=2773926 RepID=UPI0023BEF67B